MFGTLQDRLVKELADAGIATIAAANRFIQEAYLPAHNRRFAVEAAEPGTALVPWAGGDLIEILCHHEDRTVGNDNTVTFGQLKLQIEPSPLRPHFVKATVQVRHYADGPLGNAEGGTRSACSTAPLHGRYPADGRLRPTQHQAA